MSSSNHKQQQSSSNVHILTDTSSLNKSDDEKSKQHQSIRMDEHGNLIDQDGNVIHVTAKYTPTLSVNKKQQQQQQQQQQHRRTTTAFSSIAKTTTTSTAAAAQHQSSQKKRTLMDFYDEAMQEESRKRSKQFHNHHHQKHGQHGQQQEEINNMGTRKRRPLMLQFHEPGEFEQLEQRIEQQREQQLEQERQQKQFELDLEVRRQYMNEQNKKWIQYQNDQMNQMKSTVHLYMGMKPVVLSVDEYLNASLHSKQQQQQQQGEENKLKKNSTSGDDHSNGSGSGTDGGDDVELKRMLQSSLIVPHSVIEQSNPPGIEWWDQLVLPVKQFEENKELDQLIYDDFVVANEQQQNEPPLFQLHEKRVTRNLIEHDVPLSNESLDQHLNQTIIMPLMMTARERKRLKTQQRLEREREKQLKIRQGLIPAPAPKANLKNFMKVYMNDGTQDPTKLEKKIIHEIEQRKKNHDMRNEEKKLTWEQKKAKREEKLGADESNELVCVIYRIPDNGAALSHPQNRFKLNTNAKQFKISGTIILFNGASEGTNGLLIAEGGAKAVKKFCHVIENRIGWNLRFNKDKEHDGNMETNGDENDDDEDDDQEKIGKCQFMWKGTIENRSFKFFKSQQLFSDENTARNYLNSFGIAHYMDHLS